MEESAREQIEFGRLQIVEFADPSQLQPRGRHDVRRRRSRDPMRARGACFRVLRELANVSAVEELVAMIAGLRHYESSQRALRSISEAVAQNTDPQAIAARGAGFRPSGFNRTEHTSKLD